MGLSLVTAADGEPVSLEDAKLHLRVDLDTEDDLIQSYIKAARAYVEEVTGRCLISQTWDYYIDNEWPWELNLDTGANERVILLPKAPLVSVTSISYVNTAGSTTTLGSSNYVVDGATLIGRIYPAYDVEWPEVRAQNKAITVRFVAGYGNLLAVPDALRQAILLMVGHFYAQRQIVVVGQAVSKVPMAVDSLVTPWRIYW